MSTLHTAIERNRARHLRYQKAERLLRAIRVRIFDYEDEGKLEKAHRIMDALQRRLAPLWEADRWKANEEKYRNKWM